MESTNRRIKDSAIVSNQTLKVLAQGLAQMVGTSKGGGGGGGVAYMYV